MAQYDGELKIGASVDTSNVQKDAAKLAKSVKSVFTGLVAGSKEANSSLQGISNQIEKYSQELIKARIEQEKIAKTPVYSDQYKQMEADIATVNRYLESTQAQIDTLKAKQDQLKDNAFTEGFVEYSKQIQAAQYEMDKLIIKKNYLDLQKSIGKPVDDSEYSNLSDQIANATKNVEALQAAQSRFSSADVSVDTAEYRALGDEINRLQGQYDTASVKAKELSDTFHSADFQEQNIGVDAKGFDEANIKVKGLEAKLMQLASRYRETKKESNDTGEKVKKGFSGVTNTFKKVGSAIGNITNRLKSIGAHAKDNFGKMADIAKNSFSKMLRYGLSIRAIFELVKRLKQTVVESFDTMGQSIPEVGNQINEFKATLGQLKLSLATAFQPILSAVLPILNSLMSALVNVMNVLGNFFATLTGQSYIYKATKANAGLAKSVSGVGKAAKESKKELAAYDKLVVISSNDATDGGSGGGGGASGGGGFEKVPTQASGLAQQIKDAFNKKDFEGIGKAIGENLKTALDKIPWSKIRQKANKAGSTFARIINGFIKVPDLGTTIGSSIAQGLNTAWEIVNGFVTTLDWGALGTFIGQSITGFLDTFDWDLAADTLSKLVNGLADAALNVLNEVKKKLPGILTKIGNAVKKFVNEFPADKLGKIVADVINIGLQLIQELLPNLATIGTKLGQFVQTVLTETNWGDVGSVISGALGGIIDAVTNFIEQINPDDIGNALNDLFGKINIADLVGKALTLAEKLIKAIAQALQSVDWAAVGQAIGDVLSTIADHIPNLLGALGTLAWEILKGLGEAILNFAASNPLGAAITGVLVALKLTGGLSSLGSTIMSTLGTAMSGASSAISGVFSKLFAAAGPIAAVVAAGIAGWKIGNWIDSQIGEYTDAAFEGIDAAVGGPLSKARKEGAKAEAGSKIAQIDLGTNAARAEIKNAQSTAEANKIASDSYAELSKQIKEQYTGALADAEDAELQYKLGLIDETKYQSLLNEALKKNSTDTDFLNKGIYETSIKAKLASTEEFKLNTSLKDTSESVREATKSFSGMPTDVQNSYNKMQEESKTANTNITNDAKNTAIATANHYKDMYEGVPTEAQNARIKAQQESKKLQNNAKNTAKQTSKHFSDMYSHMPTDAANARIKAQQEMKKSQKENKKIAQDTAKHYTDMYKTVGKPNTAVTGLNKVNTATDNLNKNVNKSTDNMSKKFDKLGTNVTKSMTDASKKSTTALNKVNSDTKLDTVKTKFDDAKTNIVNKMTEAKTKTNAQFDAMNTHAKAQAVGSDGSGTNGKGIAGKFYNAATKIISNFTDDSGLGFKKKIKDAFNALNESAKTQATGKDGSGTEGKGIAGKFYNAAKKTISHFTSTKGLNFRNSINESFKNVTTDAETESGNVSSKYGTSTSTIEKNFNTMSSNVGGENGPLAQLTNAADGHSKGTANKYATATDTIYNNMLKCMQQLVSQGLKIAASILHIPIPDFSAHLFHASYLANGAVIPPNKEFLAVLGDQKQGVNIETPLATMVDAFNTALAQNGGGSNNNQPIVLQLDGKVIAQAVWDQNLRRYKQTGNYGFI